MRVRHLLLAGAPPQVRVHHLPLDRPRPDERDFDDQVVEAARLEARERVHLRPALHLEDTDRVGGAQVVVHRLVGHVELPQVERHPARGADVLEAVLQDGEHPQA
jgi:hypothetical protein